nr:hypothetical protein [Clostridia bacterium]
MKTYFAITLDSVFYLLAGFFLSFIPINYYLPRPASYVLAATVAIVFTLFLIKLSLEKRHTAASIGKSEKSFRRVMTALNLSDEKTLISLFDKAFKAEGFLTEKKRGGIFIKDKNATVFLKFGFDAVSKTDVVKCFNAIPKATKAEIFAEKFSDEVKAFAARFGGKVILSDGKQAYALLEPHGLLPDGEEIISPDSPRFSADFSRLLDKKRAKNFLVFGLLFTILSYIAPIKGYYLTFGAIFISFALVLRLFGKSTA